MGKFLPNYAEQYNIEGNIFVYHISTTNFMAKAHGECFEYGKITVHIISAWRVCCLRRRWEDNINMDLQKVGWGGGTDWIDLPQDRDRWRALL